MKKIRKITALIITMILALLLPACESKESQGAYDKQKPFIITFITIGKGDAFLLTMPDGSKYMIDTGKEEDFIQIGKVLKEKNVSKIDGIFLSHGHLDHTGGLKGVLNTFDVEKVYMSEKDNVSYKKIDIENIVSETDSEIVYLNGGESFDLGGVSADVWIPEKVDEENENNNSVVIKFSYGKVSCLMTGDMELEEEMCYIEENKDLEADILKLGHHGETDATSDKLLGRVKASAGIICGNKEENPESVTIEMQSRMDRHNIKVFYSDPLYSSIDFIINGEDYEVKYNENVNKTGKSNIKVSGYSKKDETVIIENTGSSKVDISDYVIVSDREKEVYVVPDGTFIEPGDTIVLNTAKMWKKKDKAVLYDNNFDYLNEFTKEN